MTMENRSALRKHMLCDRQSVPVIDIKQTNTEDKTENWRRLSSGDPGGPGGQGGQDD